MITGTVQWSYDGSTVANGDNGFTIIPLPSQDLSLLFIGAFIVDFEGIYTCADDDGSDTITLTHQGMLLYNWYNNYTGLHVLYIEAHVHVCIVLYVLVISFYRIFIDYDWTLTHCCW